MGEGQGTPSSHPLPHTSRENLRLDGYLEWGPRFPAINNAYDLPLRNVAKEIAHDLGLGDYLREGVYAMVGGPSYETVSELRALRTLGADAVGMSTAHEVIAAKHCGLRVFGLSLITNECVMEYDVQRSANHAEISTKQWRNVHLCTAQKGCGSPVVKVSNHGRHVMSSIPVPLKTRRVGQRCTLNLSRAETSSRWCGVVVWRGGASSGVIHVT
ncbi:purine nucleoside phosphorylase [Trichonephila clavipes]|nr:purine nucleoside phosphorylase [Trichonephila clavipes]